MIVALQDLMQYMNEEYTAFLALTPEQREMQLEFNSGTEATMTNPSSLRKWYLELGFVDEILRNSPDNEEALVTKSVIVHEIALREQAKITLTPSSEMLPLLVNADTNNDVFVANLFTLFPNPSDKTKAELAAFNPDDPQFIQHVTAVYKKLTNNPQKSYVETKQNFMNLMTIIEYVILVKDK